MARTKLQLIRCVNKRPVASSAVLKTILAIGTQTVRELNYSTERTKVLACEAAPDDKNKQAKIANDLGLACDLVQHEPEFIIDLMAMSAGHASAKDLEEKYGTA